MSETLVLTTPETGPSTTEWRVVTIGLDVTTPYIKVRLRSNTGQDFLWVLTPDESDPSILEDINQGLSYINQGKFATVQGKSLQRWLLEQIIARGVKLGTVSGAPD